jgi:hypothetical protein
MDDDPNKQIAEGFEGFDGATDPTKLPAQICAEGLNMYCKGDGYLETRPGSRLNSNTANGGAFGGIIYYDQPGAIEFTVLIGITWIQKIASAGNNVAATNVTPVLGPLTSFTSPVQLLDKIFYLNNGLLCWVNPNTAVAGNVTLFSDGTAMPLWSRIVVQNFRVLLFDDAGEKLYTSVIGSASVAANWVKTDNIRVGDGDGDPAKALIAGQAGFVIMLCGQSCWQIDISNATVANWSSLRVSKLTGCVEGRTAIAIGQDVYFLSRYGIVTLGALAATDSISPSTTLSAPIQPYIDQIDWANLGSAFTTRWKDMLLFALPLVGDLSYPRRLFPFNLRTRRWQAPWYYGGPHQLACACVARFGQTEETILCDLNGRMLRIDDTVTYDEYTVTVQTTYYSWAVLRRMDHGLNQQYKQPFYLELVLQDCDSLSTLLALLREGAAANTSPIGFSGLGISFNGAGGLEKKRYLIRTAGRYLEAALQIFATSGKLKVRQATLSAFIDPPFYT